jgi:hypothetical protein
MMSNIDAGTPTYLVSMKWLKRYLDFILYDQFKKEVSESNLKIAKDHFEKNQPGVIPNEKDLLEADNDDQNLYGTGNLKGFDSEFIDRYVEQ